MLFKSNKGSLLRGLESRRPHHHAGGRKGERRLVDKCGPGEEGIQENLTSSLKPLEDLFDGQALPEPGLP